MARGPGAVAGPGVSGRVGVVGCGNISNAYAEKLRALPDLELVACADLDQDRAHDLAARFEIPLVLTPEALVEHPDVDVVLNLTVPVAHSSVTRAALRAGKHAYSEKPLALEYVDGRALLDRARGRNLRLGCAPDTFLGAGLQACRALLDAGAIGTPLAANAFFHGSGPESWHPDPRFFYQRGAGPLFDVGVYYLTALVALLGPVRRITGSARISRPRRLITSQPLEGTWMDVEVPTHVAALAEHASGPVSTLVASFDVQATRYRFIEIYGTDATLSVPDPNTFGGPVQIRRNGDEEWTDMPLTHANASQSRGIGLADMVRAERSGRPHRASGDLALHVLELMEKTIAASDTGRHQQVESSCDRPAPLPPGLAEDDTGD
jgi:predicted dehydrogenase